MLLKEIIELLNLSESLFGARARIITVDDSFREDYYIESKQNETSIYCADDDVTRVINFNFDKKTITELSRSDLFIGGIVYSFNGDIISVIN